MDYKKIYGIVGEEATRLVESFKSDELNLELNIISFIDPVNLRNGALIDTMLYVKDVNNETIKHVEFYMLPLSDKSRYNILKLFKTKPESFKNQM